VQKRPHSEVLIKSNKQADITQAIEIQRECDQLIFWGWANPLKKDIAVLQNHFSYFLSNPS
jgi:hypothetical protein